MVFYGVNFDVKGLTTEEIICDMAAVPASGSAAMTTAFLAKMAATTSVPQYWPRRANELYWSRLDLTIALEKSESYQLRHGCRIPLMLCGQLNEKLRKKGNCLLKNRLVGNIIPLMQFYY